MLLAPEQIADHFGLLQSRVKIPFRFFRDETRWSGMLSSVRLDSSYSAGMSCCPQPNGGTASGLNIRRLCGHLDLFVREFVGLILSRYFFNSTLLCFDILLNLPPAKIVNKTRLNVALIFFHHLTYVNVQAELRPTNNLLGCNRKF